VSGVIGLDHVQVAAPPGCEAEARGFYGELLGLPEVPKPAELASTGGAWFACGGGQTLHIGVEADFSPATKAHPGLRVASSEVLNALAEKLIEAGAEVRWDERQPDVGRFYTSDPWGNRVELRC
jgi:catechol 2,3-dioxygenase-like lactoylglutathione lyase family enzyme